MEEGGRRNSAKNGLIAYVKIRNENMTFSQKKVKKDTSGKTGSKKMNRYFW